MSLRNSFFPALILCCSWLLDPLYAQQIRINEVMSSNQKSFYDEDQDTPDWIELYNGTNEAVNLAGYGISDDVNIPYKWIFPEILLEPRKFIILAASGKDRKTPPLFWESVITSNDTFRYSIPHADPGPWRNPEFNDNAWTEGRSGFGYGDEDDATVVPFGTITVLVRKIFTVEDLALVKKIMLHVDYDDAFVAYLNGHEIARAQIGTPGIPPAWNMQATSSDHEATLYQGGLPEAFSCDAAIPYLVKGSNVFALEVHNRDAGSSDLSCIPFLTLGMTREPSSFRGKPGFLNFPDTYLHLNFKISSGGDTLLFSDANGMMIDSIRTGNMLPDISMGLQPDGISSRWLFDEPTPGTANLGKSYPVNMNPDPSFSHPGGFMTMPADIEIYGAGASDTIWYTTDGSMPGRGTSKYSGPIHLTGSTVIRAVILGSGRMIRKPVTRSYLFRMAKPTLPTISLSTDPPNFFDWETGIYALGPHAGTDLPNWGANFWQDWERPVHIELFEPDGHLGLDVDAGVKIYGAWSRALPQKSLAFYSRKEYGNPVFACRLFPDLTFTEYNNFILRNSGNDWNRTMFRDALMGGLLDYSSLDRQAYHPAAVYLNGEYWGLLNIREKINEHYLAAHHGIDPFQIDLLEGGGSPILGNAEHYNSMIDFLTNNSPAQKANYDKVRTYMNVENFMDYQIAEIYFNNTDWPGNNIKFWRPRIPGGRWRWIVYDTDFGFGLYNEAGYAENTLAFALAEDGPGWPNPPWSTFLLRRLLENQDFKNEFINRFADRLNTSFSYPEVLHRINQMSGAIEAELPYHFDRWSQWGEDIETWTTEVETLRKFASNRVSYMRDFIDQQFSNPGINILKMSVSPAQSGSVQLNTLLLKDFPWEGYYFNRIPVRITARPNPGYRFVRWQGPVVEPLSSFTAISMNGYSAVKAVFEVDDSGLNEIVINEIYYNDPPGFDADDWLELYNHGAATIDLSGWILQDADTSHRFLIPAGTFIYPNEYLVICSNSEKYKASYPDSPPFAGDFSFGLGSSGDCIKLLTPDSIRVDSVCYGIDNPWPPEPKTEGVSLELVNPDSDNSLAINWMASVPLHGTPGKSNTLISGQADGYPDPVTGVDYLECYPNPFSVLTHIRYEVATQGWIRLSVYDLQGHLIKMLFEGETGPGISEHVWDGYGSDGSRMKPGVYIGLLETINSRSHCRIVMIQ